MKTTNIKDQKIEQYNKLPYLSRIVKCLFILYIFFLPIQTRFIYHQGMLNGGEWEYGTKSLYATEMLLLIIILLYVVGAARWLIRSQSLPTGTLAKTAKKNLKNPLIALPIILLFWSAFSILWSYDKSLAWCRWTILLEGVIVYFFVRGFNSPFRAVEPLMRRENPASLSKPGNASSGNSPAEIAGTIEPSPSAFTIPLLASAILQSILAIYQFASQQIIANKWLGMAAHFPETLGASVVETSLRRWLRSYGSLPHPNILAAYLGIAILIFLMFHLRNSMKKQDLQLTNIAELKNRGLGIIKVFILFLLSVAVIFTFSRAAWLGLFLSILILLALNKFKIKNLPPIPLFGFTILFIAILFFSKEPIIARLNGNDRLEIQSNQEHILSCKEGADIIKNHFLFGTGIGNYTLALSKQNLGLPSYSYQPAHNFFMIVWAELGIIGLIIILLFLFFIIKQSPAAVSAKDCGVREIMPIKKQGLNPLPIILLIFLFVLMLFDHYFWSLHFGIILWWLTVGIHITLIRDPYKSVSNPS